MLLAPRLLKFSEYYLHGREFAACSVTAPSAGDTDAVRAQALGAGSCEGHAVAAAAVNRLCLPAPAVTKWRQWRIKTQTPRLSVRGERANERAVVRCVRNVTGTRLTKSGATSQTAPPPGTLPSSPAWAAPARPPAPPGGCCWCWCRCVTAGNIHPGMWERTVSARHHLILLSLPHCRLSGGSLAPKTHSCQ